MQKIVEIVSKDGNQKASFDASEVLMLIKTEHIGCVLTFKDNHSDYEIDADYDELKRIIFG